jgi:hypothetical protein
MSRVRGSRGAGGPQAIAGAGFGGGTDLAAAALFSRRLDRKTISAVANPNIAVPKPNIAVASPRFTAFAVMLNGMNEKRNSVNVY